MLDDHGLRRAARALYDESGGAVPTSRDESDRARGQLIARAERRRRIRRAGDLAARSAAVLAAGAFLVARPQLFPGPADWLGPTLPSDLAEQWVPPPARVAASEPDARSEIQKVAPAPTTISPAHSHAHAVRTSHEFARVGIATTGDPRAVRRPSLAPFGAAAFDRGYESTPRATPVVAWESTTRLETPDFARSFSPHDSRGARVLAPVAEPRVASLGPLAPALRAGEHANPTVTLLAWR